MKLVTLFSILLLYSESVNSIICYKCSGDLSVYDEKGACFNPKDDESDYGCDYCMTRLSNNNKTVDRICGKEDIKSYPGEKCETKDRVTECTCKDHYCNRGVIEPAFKLLTCYECEGKNDVGNCYKPNYLTKRKDGCQHCMTRERIDEKKIKRSCEPYTRDIKSNGQDCYNFMDTDWVDARTCDCKDSNLCNSLTIPEMASSEIEPSIKKPKYVSCYVCEESNEGIVYGGSCYKPDDSTLFFHDCEHCMTKRWDGDVKIKRSCEGNEVDMKYYAEGPCYSHFDEFSKDSTVCDCKDENLCNNVPVMVSTNDTQLVSCYECDGENDIGNCFKPDIFTQIKTGCHHCMTKIWEHISRIERRCELNTIIVKPVGQQCYYVNSWFSSQFTVCNCRDSDLCNGPAKEITIKPSTEKPKVVSCFECEESSGTKIGGSCYNPDNSTNVRYDCEHCMMKVFYKNVRIKRTCEKNSVELRNVEEPCYTITTTFDNDTKICDCKNKDNCNDFPIDNPHYSHYSRYLNQKPFWQFLFNDAVGGSSPFIAFSLIPLLLIGQF